MKHNKKGFTLIELLIVIVIIGILAGVSVAVLQPAVFYGKGRNARRVSDLEAVRGALEQYFLDNARQYPVGAASDSDDATAATAYTTLGSSGDLNDYIDSWETDPGSFAYRYRVGTLEIPPGSGTFLRKCYELSVERENGEADYETCGGSLTCQVAASFCGN